MNVGPFFIALLRLKGRHQRWRMRWRRKRRWTFSRRWHFTFNLTLATASWTILLLLAVAFRWDPNGCGIQGDPFSWFFNHFIRSCSSSSTIFHQTESYQNRITSITGIISVDATRVVNSSWKLKDPIGKWLRFHQLYFSSIIHECQSLWPTTKKVKALINDEPFGLCIVRLHHQQFKKGAAANALHVNNGR